MLLHEKIRDAYVHPQFIADVIKPLQIEQIMDQEVSRVCTLRGGVGTGSASLMIMALRERRFGSCSFVMLESAGPMRGCENRAVARIKLY